VDPEEPDAASQAEAPEGSVKPAGHFRIRGKFENQCRLAAKRIEERLTVVQKLDTHGYVMVPRGAIGRLIGKGGANIKLLQRTSGASRLTFEKEGGGRSTTQACEIIASDISAAIGASKVVLEAVTVDSADARAALKARLEDYASQMMALMGVKEGDGPRPVDVTHEACVAQHRAKFGTACLSTDKQTKQHPADLAAVDFDVWLLQWAVESKAVYSNAAPK